jgi:hypothetical protein
MRVIAFAAVAALALGATACAPRVDYAHKTALDCPGRQGELTRTGVSADRRSCAYRAGDGAQVTLQLTPVSNGDASATLGAVEATLTGPPAPAAAQAAGRAGPAAPVAGGPDPERVAREAAEDAGATTASGKAAASADNDHAHVSLPGLHIDADDHDARLDIAGVHIDANDGSATVHVMREVRLRGQAFSREKGGLQAFFIARRDNLPDGYRFVGYEASGPKAGPLAVAVIRSHDEVNHGDRLYRDVQRLVRLNGGA